MRVSVIGGSRIDDETYETAREVGRLLGEHGHTIVCGGLGGTMEAACRGAREATASNGGSSAERSSANSRAAEPPDDGEAARSEHGAETVGILPGERRGAANDWVTTPIATGLGNARNVMVVLNGDAVVAVDGAAGTLSELGHALDYERPIAGLDTHPIELEGYEAVETPLEAVAFVEAAVEG